MEYISLIRTWISVIFIITGIYILLSRLYFLYMNYLKKRFSKPKRYLSDKTVADCRNCDSLILDMNTGRYFCDRISCPYVYEALRY